MAEGLLKKALKSLGKPDIEIASAGVGAVNGLEPTKETIDVMKKEGIDVSNYKSKKLTEDMIKNADLILVMEIAHKDEIIKKIPEVGPKTYLLKEFGLDEDAFRPEGFSIPDPIRRPMKDYEYCFGMIKEEIGRIAKIL
jgi:protein-tyrosine-phosphatase